MEHIKPIVTAENMKQLDTDTIEKIGIPAMVLMERAALAVVKRVKKYFKKNSNLNPNILVVCGSGNNGGDGFAIARLLYELHYDVECVFLGNELSRTKETKEQMNILGKYPIIIKKEIPNKEYAIMIDALLGIGIKGALKTKQQEIINEINDKNSYIISVDVPSGIDVDTGAIYSSAIRANETVTFGCIKRGMLFHPAKAYCGKVTCEQIGIFYKKEEVSKFTYDAKINYLLHPRIEDGNKGSFGKLLLVVGSESMAGAAILAAKAAYRMGVGMVKIVTHESNRIIIQESIPEALLLTYNEAAWENLYWREQWQNACDWADAFVFGCGCGKEAMIYKLGTDLLLSGKKPTVVDADGLLVLKELNQQKNPALLENSKYWILTPHLAELAHLLEVDIPTVKKEIEKLIQIQLTANYSVWVCKDATTIVFGEGKVYYNKSGNSGMATAGSGDVLAGIIGALVAQSCAQKKEFATSLFSDAWKGVYIHGKCGDRAARKRGKEAMIASDIIDGLSCIKEK